MKDKTLIVSVIVIILILFLSLYLLWDFEQTRQFREKIKLIDKLIYKDNNIEEIIKKEEESIVILSMSDNESKAIVKKEKNDNFDKAYEKIQKKARNYIKNNDYSVEMIKVDFVKDIKDISMKEFNMEILMSEEDYDCRYGIIIENKDKEDIILTEAELNSNKIINYLECRMDLEKLNNYLIFNEEEVVNTLPERIKIFKTISYFCDIENQVYEIDSNTGQRKINEINKKTVKEILNSSSDYLFDILNEEGEFIYGYFPLEDKENYAYNILRHAGTIWAMIEENGSTSEKKQKIKSGLNYLLNLTNNLNDKIAYIEEVNIDEIKLGGNALAVIAMCEYTNKFEDLEYLDILEKLGNGIINMQQKDGSYVHVLYDDDFSVKEEYRTVYYDGEATFALCKLYSITKDKKYLKAAEKSIQYFIDNDYEQYCDQWISYAVNEITKYVEKEEYYEFGLKNISSNLKSIKNKSYTSHVNFEMLIQGFELYYRIHENKIKVSYLKEFPIEEFIDTIKHRAKVQLKSYLYPEVAMYLNYPKKYANTFYIRHEDFRIRIDDIQHSILGYHFYNKNLKNINIVEETIKNRN